MKGKQNSQGFGIVSVLFAIVVIGTLSFGGWYVYHQDHKVKTTASTSNSGRAASGTTLNKGSRSAGNSPAGNVIASGDGKVQVTLPDDWGVVYPASAGQSIATGTLPADNCGAVTISQAQACAYVVGFRPKAIGSVASTANDSWSLNVMQSSWTAERAAQSAPLGHLSSVTQGTTVVQSKATTIGGYPAYLVELSNDTGEIDTYYFVTHDGYLTTIEQNIQPVQTNSGTLPNPISQDTYLSDFTAIADSLRLRL